MPLPKPLQKHENFSVPAPPAIPAAGGRKGRLLTTFPAPLSGYFKQNQPVIPIWAAGNDDFRTTLGRPDDDFRTTQ